jgi:hypothetical protein
MWYIAIVIMLVVALFVSYRMTMMIDKRLTTYEQRLNRIKEARNKKNQQNNT